MNAEVPAVPAVSALESSFPAAMLSEVGTKESWRKEIHRPATSTHKWWAKRLGTVFRGIITAAVAADREEAIARYESPTALRGMVVLDPFAGSGTTAVEALKLGANAVSLDINPVATLVQRQAVQRWDAGLLAKAFEAVESACRAEIDRVHRTSDGRTVLYYFWVATAPCPECDDTVHLFDSPVYSRNAYPSRVPRAQLVCPACLDLSEGTYDFIHARCAAGHLMTQQGNVHRSAMTCGNGHTTKVLTALGDSRPGYRMYAKMVVDAFGAKTYEPITDADRALYAECERRLAALPPTAVLPVGTLEPGNNTDQALNWNFRQWRHFFNARQLYSLSLLATAIRDLDAPPAEREAICALFSGTLEFNNLFASFKGEGTGAVRHMFAHHVLKPERTPLEAHPWGTPYSSGSFSTLLRSRLHRAHGYKQAPADLVATPAGVQRTTTLSRPLTFDVAESWPDVHDADGVDRQWAYVATGNAAATDLPDESVDLVVTDPPYMDNVHYAELADFFHAWLHQMRPYDGYPDAPSTRTDGEVQHADPAEFGRALQAVWAECARVLKPTGLLAFTFHQARMTGWVELTRSLRVAGLTVTAVQPVKGEMTTSVVKAGAKEPSNLDSVVVCRKAVAGAAAGRPRQSAEDACAVAVARLTELIDAGVAVGAGDVRSVVRGTLLSRTDPAGPVDLDDAETLRAVDELADHAVSELVR